MSSGETSLLSARHRALQLLRQLQDGDASARDSLVLENLGLVAHVLKRFYVPSKERDDAFNEGVLGLLRAIDGFDFSKNTTFSTYATLWIHKRIYDYLSYRTQTIRLPESALSLRRQIQALRREIDPDLSDAEIASSLGVSLVRIREVQDAPHVAFSVDSLEDYERERIGI